MFSISVGLILFSCLFGVVLAEFGYYKFSRLMLIPFLSGVCGVLIILIIYLWKVAP